MKIIQVIPDLCLAGAQIMCENLINEFVTRGHSVSVISLYKKNTHITERLEEKGVKIYYLDKQKGLDLSMIPKLKKIFLKEKPDVVHSHLNAMQYVVPAAFMAGIKKKVHTIHSVASKEFGKLAKFAAFIFYRLFNVVPVALSDAVRDSIVNVYKLSPGSIPVVFNGTDMSKCISKTDYSRGDMFTIVHVGRFSTEKNHAMLLRAFKRFHYKYPATKLQLIGDGKKRSEIETYIIENSLTDSVEL